MQTMMFNNVPHPYAIDVLAGTILNTDAFIVLGGDMMADVLINVLASTVNGVVTDLATLTDVDANRWAELTALPLSLEELLLLCRALRCWPTAGCRDAQACMPSYHVC